MNVRRLVATTALLAALAAGATAPASAAPADEPGGEPGASSSPAASDPSDLVSFGVAPAGPQRADDRPYLSFSVPPGSVIDDYVAVINQGAQPLDLDVYAGDVLMAQGGGLAVSTRDAAPADAGSWITLDGPRTVQVPPQTPGAGFGFTIVPLHVAVPADAEPGDHVGAVVVSLTAAGQGGKNAPNIQLEQRVAARVYVRVQGDVAPGLAVRDVRADYRPKDALGRGAATVTYTLTNTGNVRVAVESDATIAGPFGLLARTVKADRVDELLPGGSTDVTVQVPGLWPLVRDTVTVRASAAAPAAGEAPDLPVATGSTVLWPVPWLVLGVLLALVALVVWRRRARKARRRRLAAAPAGSRRAVRAGAPDPAVRPASAPSGEGAIPDAPASDAVAGAEPVGH